MIIMERFALCSCHGTLVGITADSDQLFPMRLASIFKPTKQFEQFPKQCCDQSTFVICMRLNPVRNNRSRKLFSNQVHAYCKITLIKRHCSQGQNQDTFVQSHRNQINALVAQPTRYQIKEQLLAYSTQMVSLQIAFETIV